MGVPSTTMLSMDFERVINHAVHFLTLSADLNLSTVTLRFDLAENCSDSIINLADYHNAKQISRSIVEIYDRVLVGLDAKSKEKIKIYTVIHLTS